MNILFTSRIFNNLHLPWKTELPWNFLLYGIYFLLFRIFEQLARALKNSFPGIFHCIEIFFIIQDFWATSVCPEKQSMSRIFSLYRICIFIIQDFRATSAYPEKQSCPENFHCMEYTFYIQNFWATALALKNRVALDFFTVFKYFLSFRIFEQLAFALKIFTVMNILFTFIIFEQLALALKKRVCPGNFHCIEIYFIVQHFWATCAYPEKQTCPEIFHLHWEFLSNLRLPWKTELPWLHCTEYV